MPKILHDILSDPENWRNYGAKKHKNILKEYIESENFTKDQYVNFLSGLYSDDFYDITEAAIHLKDSKLNTEENNDKVVSNLLKDKSNEKRHKDENYYWKSDLIGSIFKNLNHSKKSLNNVIDFTKKLTSKEKAKENLLSQLYKSPKLDNKSIKKLVEETDYIDDDIIKHPKMDSKLFKHILKEKNYKNLPTSAFQSDFLDSEDSLKILNASEISSQIPLDNLLSKLPKSARKDYIHEKLGITGGEKMPERYGYQYYDNEWNYGPGRSDRLAQTLAQSKHLTPEAIEHIKNYGSFDEKYNLFENEKIDPKHAIEMAVKWSNNEDGYDEDELKEKIKENTEDSLWEDYSDEAREEAQEEYSMDEYLRDIGDDQISETLFDKGYEQWKKDWIKENKDLNAPNPNFDPSEPESEDNPKTILFDADEYDSRYDVEDHPNFIDYDSEAETAFEEAKRSADLEPFYNDYDESINESVSQKTYDLRDKAIDNWTESEHLLPSHVYDKLKSPFKDKDNPTEKELSDALEHPLKVTRNAAAKNEKLTPKLIDKVLNGDDEDVKARVLANPNVTSDQLMTAIKESKNEYVLSNALGNIKTRPEHVQEAINRHSDNDSAMKAAFNSHSANDNHVKSFLNIAKTHDNPYNLNAIIDSKFNLSSEDVDFIYNHFDQWANHKGMSDLLDHHSATKKIVEKGLDSRYETVKSAAVKAQERRFPQTADPVNVKIGTHPLRILRDLVTEHGGTVTKGKLKSMGINADKFTSIFKPNGTISAEDVQKVIDSAPSKTYNTSHGTWNGGQRHSGEPSKVFQLNYTQEHLDQMQKEGVLDTFKKIYDVSFRSGHPVKNNTIGWVRYTGNPTVELPGGLGSTEGGFHIDEIQSDLGQSIIQQTIQQAKHAMENEGLTPEEAERAVANAKRDFPDDHLKKINTILFGDKHPSEVLHEGFKEYIRNRGFGDSPIQIWQPESKAPISGMSTSTKISPSDVDDLIDRAKKGTVSRDTKVLIAWGQKNKLAPASFKDVTTEHLDQIKNQYKEFANKHREQHNSDPELPVQLPVHMVEGYGKIPKAMGYKDSFYGKLPTQSGKEHLAQENIPAKQTFEEKVRKQEELDKGLKGDWEKEGYTVHKTYLSQDDAEGLNALDSAIKNGLRGGLFLRPKQNEPGKGDVFYNTAEAKKLLSSGSHVLDGMGPFIYAKDSSGNVIGGLIHDNFEVLNNWVHQDHQRKGISTAMHQIANSENQKQLRPGSLSEEGKKLWSDREKTMTSGFKKEELDKGLKGDWEKEGYTVKEADPGKYYDYAIEAHHPEHGLVGRARFKAHGNGNFLIPGDVAVKEDHQRKGLGSAMYRHAAKVYAPIKNLATHQTVAAHSMWEKKGHTFNKEELGKGSVINPSDVPRVTPETEEYDAGVSYEGDSPELKQAVERGKALHFPLSEKNLKNVYMFHDETLEGHYDPESKDWIEKNPELARKNPVLIARHPDGSLHVTDGQHRFNSAIKSGQSHVKAFIFNVPEQHIESIQAPKHISEFYPQFKKSEEEAPTVLYHYSKEPGLKEIDPKRMGTGVPGQFRSKFNPSQLKDFPHASFHYIQDKPEDLVSSDSKAKYVLKLNPDQKIYDISEDKDSLVREAIKENQGAWNYEQVLKKIKNAGYYGVMARRHENPVIANTAMLFYNHPIDQELKP